MVGDSANNGLVRELALWVSAVGASMSRLKEVKMLPSGCGGGVKKGFVGCSGVFEVCGGTTKGLKCC